MTLIHQWVSGLFQTALSVITGLTFRLDLFLTGNEFVMKQNASDCDLLLHCAVSGSALKYYHLSGTHSELQNVTVPHIATEGEVDVVKINDPKGIDEAKQKHIPKLHR